MHEGSRQDDDVKTIVYVERKEIAGQAIVSLVPASENGRVSIIVYCKAVEFL